MTSRPRPLPLTSIRTILGHQVHFATNSPHVISLIDDSFGPVPSIPSPTEGEPLRVRIAVEEATEPRAHIAPVHHRSADRGRLLVTSGRSVGESDPECRESRAVVTRGLVAHPTFRVEVLEALTMALLSHFDRHPLHAAAVRRGHRSLLLVGPSGAGKSTLAYAAHRAGLETLAEDRVWVQLAPHLRIWSRPTPARLRPDAAAHFPELSSADIPSTVDGTDRCLATFSSDQREAAADGDVRVVLLARSPDDARLEPLTPTEIADALITDVAPGFDRFPGRNARVARTLATPGGWRLHLSTNPDDAIRLLSDLVKQ